MLEKEANSVLLALNSIREVSSSAFRVSRGYSYYYNQIYYLIYLVEMYEVVLIHNYELIIEPKFKVYNIFYSSNCNTLEDIYNLLKFKSTYYTSISLSNIMATMLGQLWFHAILLIF